MTILPSGFYYSKTGTILKNTPCGGVSIFQWRRCVCCGRKFLGQKKYNRPQPQFCSKSCILKFNNPMKDIAVAQKHCGKNHWNWRGGSFDHGYKIMRVKNRGYIRVHRLIVEKIIGRELHTWEIVHHIDSNLLNNRPKNLRVMSRATHARLHRIKKEN